LQSVTDVLARASGSGDELAVHIGELKKNANRILNAEWNRVVALAQTLLRCQELAPEDVRRAIQGSESLPPGRGSTIGLPDP